MKQAALAKITDQGGVAYQFDDGYVVTVPQDGEYLFGMGADLEDVLDAITASDGLAADEDGVIVKPYLELQEALDEMESFTGGNHQVLVDATKGITPAS